MESFEERQKELFTTMMEEECAELIQILSKIKRFGLRSECPYDGRLNREILIGEMGDVIGMIELLKNVPYYNITDEELEEAKQKRIRKANWWLNNPLDKVD